MNDMTMMVTFVGFAFLCLWLVRCAAIVKAEDGVDYVDYDFQRG